MGLSETIRKVEYPRRTTILGHLSERRLGTSIHYASYILGARRILHNQIQPADHGSKQRVSRLTSSWAFLSGQLGVGMWRFRKRDSGCDYSKRQIATVETENKSTIGMRVWQKGVSVRLNLSISQTLPEHRVHFHGDQFQIRVFNVCHPSNTLCTRG